MRKSDIRVEPSAAFFERAREIAKRADRGAAIPSSCVIAFEDFESLLPNRDRSAVTRGVQVLPHYGVVQVTEKILPGHGKQKWVTPIAREIHLTAEL